MAILFLLALVLVAGGCGPKSFKTAEPEKPTSIEMKECVDFWNQHEIMVPNAKKLLARDPNLRATVLVDRGVLPECLFVQISRGEAQLQVDGAPQPRGLADVEDVPSIYLLANVEILESGKIRAK